MTLFPGSSGEAARSDIPVDAILRVDMAYEGEWEKPDSENDGKLACILRTEVADGLAVRKGAVLAKEPLGDVYSTIFTVVALDLWSLTCEYAPDPRLVEEEPCVRLETWHSGAQWRDSQPRMQVNSEPQT